MHTHRYIDTSIYRYIDIPKYACVFEAKVIGLTCTNPGWYVLSVFMLFAISPILNFSSKKISLDKNDFCILVVFKESKCHGAKDTGIDVWGEGANSYFSINLAMNF